MRDSSIRESLTQSQWNRIFYGCPGAWAGNPPKPDQPGIIVIDGTKISAAVQFLNRNHVRVLSAKAPLPEIWCADGGIILIITLQQ
jgi:hypothetical protein